LKYIHYDLPDHHFTLVRLDTAYHTFWNKYNIKNVINLVKIFKISMKRKLIISKDLTKVKKIINMNEMLKSAAFGKIPLSDFDLS